MKKLPLLKSCRRIATDNDRVLKSRKTVNFLTKVRKLKTQEQPVYSPDVSVLDGCVFGNARRGILERATKNMSAARFRELALQEIRKTAKGAGNFIRSYRARLQRLIQNEGYVL